MQMLTAARYSTECVCIDSGCGSEAPDTLLIISKPSHGQNTLFCFMSQTHGTWYV